MSITAKELAQRLHLSAATVSMVLNRKPGISDETRDLVLSEAKRCGYDFSKIKTPPPGTVYLVVYKKHGEVVGDTPFFFQVIEGIETTCRDAGYRLQLFYFNEVAPAAEQIELINNSGCSGVILLGTEMFLEDYRPFQSLHVPLVVLDSYYDELPFTTVLINNARGAFLATDYLVSEGHRDIGYLQSARAISNFEERPTASSAPCARTRSRRTCPTYSASHRCRAWPIGSSPAYWIRTPRCPPASSPTTTLSRWTASAP